MTVPAFTHEEIIMLNPSIQQQRSTYAGCRFTTPAEWEEFNKAVQAAGSKKAPPVYVKFVCPTSKRLGSIARVTEWTPSYQRYYNTLGRPNNTARWTNTMSLGYEARWDKRSKSLEFNNTYEHIAWLKGYTGTTDWQYDRTRLSVPRKDTVDRLGRDIAVGDFCCYILYHFDSNGAAGVYFGNVSQIGADGTVWCKNIALGSDDKVAEKRVKDNSQITIITKDLMQQLMLARLSA